MFIGHFGRAPAESKSGGGDFGPAAPSAEALAASGILVWVGVAWAQWIERHPVRGERGSAHGAP